MTGSILLPAGEAYSGEPVVVTLCQPGAVRKGHINPVVVFVEDAEDGIVRFTADVQAPPRPGTYELWVLVEREPASVAQVVVERPR